MSWMFLALALAAADADDKPAPPPLPPHTGVRATLKAIPDDFRHLPSKDALKFLLPAAAVTLAVHPFDRDMNAHLRGSGAVHRFFTPGRYIGEGQYLVGASLATWAVGRAIDNRVVSHLGMDMVRSTIETGALTYALKGAFRRKRPSGACCSFPSGHASITFAAASVLQRHLGWKGTPAYLVSSYVALSRLHENRHYVSDVVFGSALGLIVGRAVTRHGARSYTLLPMPLPGGGGLMIAAGL